MGKQPIIVLDSDLSEYADQSLFLVDNEWCYGTIRLLPPNKIDEEMLSKRRNINLIMDSELSEMDKEMLYEYPFQWINKFEVLMKWKSETDGLLIESLEFPSESNFHNMEKLTQNIDEDQLYLIRDTFNGLDVNLIRSQTRSTILLGDKDVSNMFPQLSLSLSKISPNEVLLSGKLVFYDNDNKIIDNAEKLADMKNNLMQDIVPYEPSKIIVQELIYGGA